MTSHMTQLISIVLPVFNEQENIVTIYTELVEKLAPIGDTYALEILFVDDGSLDDSWKKIQLLSSQDARVRGIKLSRNFGNQVALTAGFDKARGVAVVSMDADLQHPPAIIPDMIAKWQAGARVVYGRRINRINSPFKKIAAKLYCWLLNKVAQVPIPPDATDFRLLDQKVLHVVRETRDQAHFLRGAIAWAGFKTDFVTFEVRDRKSGTSAYSWQKMVSLALNGLTGFSIWPLRLAAFIGFFVIITGTMMLLFIIGDILVRRVYYPLFKWLATINYIFMGVQFLLLWIVGEYIGKMYDQTRNRPLYVIEDEVNTTHAQ